MRLAEMDGGVERFGGKIERNEPDAEIDRDVRGGVQEIRGMRGMSQRVPNVGSTARLRTPLVPESAIACRVASDSSARVWRTWAAYIRPTSVSTTRWRVRLNRDSPSVSSSCWICRETALWVRLSSSAARETELWRAVASKARRLPTLGRKPRRSTQFIPFQNNLLRRCRFT